MALASHLIAFALAAAQPAAATAEPAAPAAPAPAADTAALLDLFERVCLRSEAPPAGFARTQWSDFPAPLQLMNTYGHEGTFLRGETPALTYVASTRGSAHLGPGLETRCGVAARGADVSRIVSHLAERAGAQAVPPVEMDGVSMSMLIGNRGAFTVYETQDNGVIVRSLGILIPAEMVRPRDRRRGGKRN